MVSERELVGLLYRADWTKLTLSGTVRGTGPVIDSVISVQSDEPLSGPWQREDAEPIWTFEPGGEGAARSLSVAPGRRFRAEDADGAWAVGSDGARLWHWFRDRPAGVFAGFDDRPRPPYRTLLVPSWLLTRYSLVLDGEVTACGRAGVRVLGTPRQVAERAGRFSGGLGRNASGGGLFAPIPRWLSLEQWSEVEAVVDAELGILLRCSERAGDEPPSVTEFMSLDVGGLTEASRFSAPSGSVFGGDKGSWTRGPGDRPADGAAGAPLGDALGEALGAAGKEAAKTVAGMAAGGLGALIRYAPKWRQVDPFARAAAEAADPEADMPTDEPDPDGPAGEAAPVLADEVLADEVLHLVYRSGLAAPSLRATLHQWRDLGTVLAAVPPSARGKGFGGVGFLVDAVRDLTREAMAGDNHAVSTVAMGGWNEYRIDVVRSIADAAIFPAGRLNRHVALTIASDGVRQWKVYSDRVLTGAAASPPSDLADLVDASWLLDNDLDLSGGTEVWLGGRRAYRIVARYREEAARSGMGWWGRLFYPAVAVVDAETGQVLRLTRFKGGRPAVRQELRDVAALDAGADFGFTPPAGLPVYGAESERDEGRPGTRA
jgi:hypothetical protein